MKPVLTILIIFSSHALLRQENPFTSAQNWKIYNVSKGNLFSYSIDTLKNFQYYALHSDSMRQFMGTLSTFPEDDPPRWMGAHIATCEIGGITRKIEISLYGGFFYDEVSKKHYQLPEEVIDDWLAYIRQCFMGTHK